MRKIYEYNGAMHVSTLEINVNVHLIKRAKN